MFRSTFHESASPLSALASASRFPLASMPMKLTGVFALLALAGAPMLAAAPRPWRSSDGQRSITGDFVRRDDSQVTIVRSDRTEVAIPFEKLHPDDLAWLNAEHPAGAKTVTSAPASATPTAAEGEDDDGGSAGVFDRLAFGDTRDQVLEKLKRSKFVTMTCDETFIGRTGLNGIFRLSEKVGGLEASLYFDWDGAGRLTEITLQTEMVEAARFSAVIEPCWKAFIPLLTKIYGTPLHSQGQLDQRSMPEGALSSTHLWKLEPEGSAMLGAVKEAGKCQVAVRFTKRNVAPVAVP